MADNDFWTDTAAEAFDFVKHNKLDYKAFRDYTKDIDERFSALENKRQKEERLAALDKWDKSLPERWKDAKLSKIDKPVVPKILEALKERPRGSFFLYGDSGAGKTFVAYGLLRRLIGRGVATPGQIKQLSESVLLRWATQGFRGTENLNEALDPPYKLYFFDGIGSLDDHEAAKVSGFWEQLIDHIFSRDLMAVFTSTDSLERFSSSFSPSGETKLYTLLGGKSFRVEDRGSRSVKAQKK